MRIKRENGIFPVREQRDKNTKLIHYTHNNKNITTTLLVSNQTGLPERSIC